MDELRQGLMTPPELYVVQPEEPTGRRRRRRWLLPVLSVFTALGCLAALLVTQLSLCITVKLDGEPLGRLSGEEELEAIVASVEENVSTIVGRPYAVEDRLTWSLGVARASEVSELDGLTVEKAIYDGIDEIDMHYVITIDGLEAGYIAELNTLRTAMDDRLEALVTGDTLSASYLSEVEFDLKYVDVDEELDEGAIEELVENLSVEKVERVTFTETIPYEVQTVVDEERYIEDSQVVQPGSEGEAEVVAEVVYVDDEEEQLTVLQTSVVADPVDEIFVEGTQERPVTASYGEYIWPVAGTVTSYFGPRRVSVGSSNHQGIDIGCPANEYVYAADGGEVIFAGWSGGYGNLVQILHDNGHVTYYAHNNSLDVSVGDLVYQGQLIARAGMTGTASGNHVHFEIRIDGEAVDPMDYLP